MPWPDVVEVAAIERGHRVEVESLSDGDDRRLGAAESPVRRTSKDFSSGEPFGPAMICTKTVSTDSLVFDDHERGPGEELRLAFEWTQPTAS